MSVMPFRYHFFMDMNEMCRTFFYRNLSTGNIGISYPIAWLLCSSWASSREQANNNGMYFVRFEVFTAVTMKNAVFWDVTPCCSSLNYWTAWSHLLTLVPRSRIFLPWRWRGYVPPKRRFRQELHGVTSQKTAFFEMYFVIIILEMTSRTLLRNKPINSFWILLGKKDPQFSDFKFYHWNL
jgi:hypothetical protein